MIALLSETLSELPWDKYYQFAFPGLGGAMENISLVTWDEYWVLMRSCTRIWEHWSIRSICMNLLIRGLGISLSVGTIHMWLKESWATYMETVWKEKTMDADSYHMELISQRRRYFGEVKSRYSRPIQTSGYLIHLGKCMMPIFTLVVPFVFICFERRLETTYFGRELRIISKPIRIVLLRLLTFASVLKRYLICPWLNFSSSGLKERVIHIVESKYSKSGRTLEIKSRQKLIGADKDAPMFEFDVEVAVEYADGSWENHTLNISSEYNVYSTKVNSEPVQIVVNPNCASVVQFDLVFPSAYYDRTLEDCPYVYGRVRVAETLITSGKPRQ